MDGDMAKGYAKFHALACIMDPGSCLLLLRDDKLLNFLYDRPFVDNGLGNVSIKSSVHESLPIGRHRVRGQGNRGNFFKSTEETNFL